MSSPTESVNESCIEQDHEGCVDDDAEEGPNVGTATMEADSFTAITGGCPRIGTSFLKIINLI